MAWKTLVPVVVRLAEPWISIQRSGKMTWSMELHRRMGEPGAIELLYDSARERIGIRPATNGDGITLPEGKREWMARTTLRVAGLIDKLELPISMRPACETDGIWAISVKPDDELLGDDRPRRSRKAEGE